MLNISPIQSKISGRVARIDVLEKGIIVQSLEGFNNLILDSGLDILGTISLADAFKVCAVGTGSTAPAVNNTQLVAEVARTSIYLSGVGNCGTTRNTATKLTHKRTFDFPVGALNGNYTELGFSWTNAPNGGLFSRVLIKSGGVPISLTVTNAQQLRVVYEVSVEFSTVISNWNLNFGGNWGAVSGVSALQNTNPPNDPIVKTIATDGYTNENQFYAYWGLEHTNTLESISTCSTNEPLAAIGGFTSRTQIGGAILVSSPYANGTFYRDRKASFGVNDSNGVIQALTFGRTNAWAAVFNAPKTKTNLETLSFTLRYAWGRL